MRVRMSRLVSAAAVAAVLALTVTLLVNRGLLDALLMIALVAALAALYRVRHHARAQVLYRRRAEEHRADDPRVAHRTIATGGAP
jgi:hypothetical protein